MKFCFQLTGRICNVAVFSCVFNGDWIFPRFLFLTSEFFICGSFTSGEPPLLTYDFLTYIFCIELFYSLFLVHIFLPVNVLLLNFLPVDLLLLESRRSLPMIFLHMILFTCVKLPFFTCECFTCGFFTCRESPLFTCDFFTSGFCTCGSVLGFAVCASCFLLLIFSPQNWS